MLKLRAFGDRQHGRVFMSSSDDPILYFKKKDLTPLPLTFFDLGRKGLLSSTLHIGPKAKWTVLTSIYDFCHVGENKYCDIASQIETRH
jgi:hypothetical protein